MDKNSAQAYQILIREDPACSCKKVKIDVRLEQFETILEVAMYK